MAKIRFTEARLLLSGERVEAGDERDFGESENAAFVNNKVSVWATDPAPAAPVAPAPAAQAASSAEPGTPAAPAAEEVKTNG